MWMVKMQGVKKRGEWSEIHCDNVVCSNPSYQIKHAQLWRKMEVISDVKTLPCGYYYFGHWPFSKFQYSFLLHRCLVFLGYLFTKDEDNIMETMRHQDLNFALTWNLFRFHIQVGCYFLSDAFRLIHIKFTNSLELVGGTTTTKKDAERSEMLFFFWHRDGIFKCKYFQTLAMNFPVCWVSFIEWCYFPMDIKSLSEMSRRS